MKQPKALTSILIGLLLLNGLVKAQESWKPGDPLNIKFGKGDSTFTLTPWASFRFTLTATNGEVYLNDPGTRVGFKFRQPCTKNFALYGNIELSMKLASTGESMNFSPGNATDEYGLYNLTTSSKDQVFGLRQTYIGFDFFKWGRLTLGKQMSAYLDIADRTDISTWNSGFASYAYSPEGSDGGLTRTGRANSCITYRNDFAKRIHFAASVQMKINNLADSLNNNINSAGGSVIIDIIKGFDFAFGYQQVFFNENYFNPDLVYGLTSNPSYLIVGTQFKNQNLKVGVNFASQMHGDLTTASYVDSNINKKATVVYSGTGLEVIGDYKFNKWKFQTGVNWKLPQQDENKILSSGFERQIIFYGVGFYPVKNIALIFEGRYENSHDADGNTIPNTNMIGLRIDF